MCVWKNVNIKGENWVWMLTLLCYNNDFYDLILSFRELIYDVFENDKIVVVLVFEWILSLMLDLYLKTRRDNYHWCESFQMNLNYILIYIEKQNSFK